MHIVYHVQHSNKTTVINAITYTLLAGPVNKKAQQDAVRIKTVTSLQSHLMLTGIKMDAQRTTDL